MATPSRRTGIDLRNQLAREPFRFEFAQAVRLFERAAAQEPRDETPRDETRRDETRRDETRRDETRRDETLGAATLARRPVGEDESPQAEVLRFRSVTSFAFPPGDIAALELLPADEDRPVQMSVAFLGLTGPAGVLPQHYTQLLIDRVRQRDFSLRDFFDLFHHRLISLFYRAWRKYRHVVGYERAAETGQPADDCFTSCLYSLTGWGTGHLRGRQEVDDEAFLYYAGHFAHAPHSAAVLEQMVADYLGMPARVRQFVGQWLQLVPDDRSYLPSPRRLTDSNNVLGQNVVAGERVWGIENRFRLTLGPLSYAEFQRFSPRGDCLRRLAQFVRSYVGVAFDFDVQPVLRAAEVPPIQLGGESNLGWNTWLRSQPLRHDADDAVFPHEGWPNYR